MFLDCVWKICGHSIERLKKLEKSLGKEITMSQREISHKTKELTKLSSSLSSTTKKVALKLKLTTSKKELASINVKIKDQ